MQLWCEALSLLLCCYQWAAQPHNTRKPTGFRYLVVSGHVMYGELLPISEHIKLRPGRAISTLDLLGELHPLDRTTVLAYKD
jgi:hypothetical protein